MLFLVNTKKGIFVIGCWEIRKQSEEIRKKLKKYGNNFKGEKKEINEKIYIFSKYLKFKQ